MNDLPEAPTELSNGIAPAWHTLDSETVLYLLMSRMAGLTGTQANERLSRHGRNELPPPPRRHPAMRLLAQFHNTLIYFLLAAAIAAFALGHVIDAGVIVTVVVVNAVVGFVQEGRAEQALDAIRDMIAPKASVLRDGRRISHCAAELVPGDIVLIEAGDQVPADLRLMRARALLVDEAILTGESVAAQKREAPVTTDAQLGNGGAKVDHCSGGAGSLRAA